MIISSCVPSEYRKWHTFLRYFFQKQKTKRNIDRLGKGLQLLNSRSFPTVHPFSQSNIRMIFNIIIHSKPRTLDSPLIAVCRYVHSF